MVNARISTRMAPLHGRMPIETVVASKCRIDGGPSRLATCSAFQTVAVSHSTGLSERSDDLERPKFRSDLSQMSGSISAAAMQATSYRPGRCLPASLSTKS
jgi:hypothetical protein